MVVLPTGMMWIRLTMLVTKKGSQQMRNTNTMTTTMRVTLRSDRRRFVRPTRALADLTWKTDLDEILKAGRPRNT